MIRFEKADIQDAQSLVKVQVRAFAADAEICGDGPPGYDSPERQISLMNSHIYYKIVENDIIIGGFYIYPEDNGDYELVRLFIDPEYQNKGIGKSTLKYVEKMFSDIRKIELETPSFSMKNHVFYEKMGYLKIGEIKYGEDSFSYKYVKVFR